MIATRSTAFAVAIVALHAHGVQAQRLEDRIAAASGTVAFNVTTRPNVCGDGRSIFVSEDTSPGWNRRQKRGMHMGQSDSEYRTECEIAPERVIVEHDGRTVTSLRARVGGDAGPADVSTRGRAGN